MCLYYQVVFPAKEYVQKVKVIMHFCNKRILFSPAQVPLKVVALKNEKKKGSNRQKHIWALQFLSTVCF